MAWIFVEHFYLSDWFHWINTQFPCKHCERLEFPVIVSNMPLLFSVYAVRQSKRVEHNSARINALTNRILVSKTQSPRWYRWVFETHATTWHPKHHQFHWADPSKIPLHSVLYTKRRKKKAEKKKYKIKKKMELKKWSELCAGFRIVIRFQSQFDVKVWRISVKPTYYVH